MTDIWELFREEEERRVAAERKLMAAEDAAWAALPQAERDRIIAEREAKWDARPDEPETDDEEYEDEEYEDEEEDDDE